MAWLRFGSSDIDVNHMNSEVSEVHAPLGWEPFVPAMFFGVLSALIILWLAPRKGQTRWLALVAIAPCIGPFIVVYLLALTDKRVLDEIEALKKQANSSINEKHDA